MSRRRKSEGDVGTWTNEFKLKKIARVRRGDFISFGTLMAASLMRRREPGTVLDFSREEDDEPELKRIENGPEIVVSDTPIAFAHPAPADRPTHIQIG